MGSRAVESVHSVRRLDAIAVGAAVAGACALLLGVVAGSTPVASATAVGLLIPAAIVDLRIRRLPDLWVGAAAVGFMVTAALSSSIDQAAAAPPIGSTLAGIAVLAGPILVLHLVAPAAMGFGDVKAAAVLGAATGYVDWRLTLVASTLAAGTAGAVGIAARLRTVPFGPFLVASAVIVLLTDHVWLLGLVPDGSAP